MPRFLFRIPERLRRRRKSSNPETPRIRLRSPMVPALLAAAVLAQCFFPNKIWTVLIVGFLGVLVAAVVWIRSLAGGLRLFREMRFGWAQVGDRIEERFTLANDGRMPALWVEVRDRSTMPGYNPGCATGVEGGGENRWSTKGVCSRRGVYQLGPTGMMSGDPFGVFQAEWEYPSSSTFVVMPAVVPLPHVEVAYGGKAGEGRPRSDSPERTVGASGVRPYVLGDSLRWIHWPTSARTGSLYVRLFDGTPVGDWWIFLDLAEAQRTGGADESLIEHGVILAASLANRGMLEGHAVGLVAHDRERLYWHSPREGVSQFWSIMRSLALVSGGKHPVGHLLGQIRPQECDRSSLILITADVTGGWLQDLLRAVQRGARPTVLLLDPSSYGGTGSPAAVQAGLVDLNIPVYPVTKDMLNIHERRDREQDVDMRVTPTGGVVVVRGARNLSWRSLE